MKNLYNPFKGVTCSVICLLLIATQAHTQNFSLDATEAIEKGNQNVVASFSVNAEKQCLVGNRFVITNNSSAGSGVSYFWDFGDGTNSTDASPVKAYAHSGNFRIHLEVRNGNDYAFVEKFINVMPTPIVDYNTLTGTLNGKSFTFISSSTIESGSMNYFWNLGDNTTSTLINPTKTYAAEGTYHVQLIVTSDFGCTDSITKTIIYGTPAPIVPPVTCVTPTATFSVNAEAQCKHGNNFIFTNTSSVSSGSLSYAWDFGDGTISTSKNATKTFASIGEYTVKLLVTNSLNGGCSTLVSKQIKVVGTVAEFVANPVSEQCFKNNIFNFTNESHANHSGLHYAWDLGDGTTSTETNPTHSYSTAGIYQAKLIATIADYGCADTLSVPIKVYPSPTASFTVVNAQQCRNKNFSFTNTSTITGDGVNYSWYFGDTNSSVERNPSHLYSNTGNHTVTLVASSNHGCRDTVSHVITTNEIVAAFVVNPVSIQCFKNNAFVFTNESHASTSGLQYQWDLSGGVTATNTNPSRSYNAAGTYSIQLIAKTPSNGCADTLVKTLTINPSPTVDFTSNIISYTDNTLTVNLTNTAAISSGSINYAWNFGDGQSSVANNTTHVFANNVATRTVSLTVSSDKGCSETVTKVISMTDGQARTSSNNSVSNNTPTPGRMDVYPNPAQSFVQLNVHNQTNAPVSSNVTARIIDFNGRVVAQRTQATNSNTTLVTMNVSNLVSGNYFVETLDSNGRRIATNTMVKK